MRSFIALLLYFMLGVAMAGFTAPIKELEVGPYAEIASRPNPNHLTIGFIPSLAAILLSVEKKKGSPLTQREVEAVRDHASVFVSNAAAAQAVDERRGYKDVDPLHCWEQWQELRTQLPH